MQRPYIYLCDGALPHADPATVIWCAARHILIFFTFPKSTHMVQMMDGLVLSKSKREFHHLLTEHCRHDIYQQPSSVIIKMFGAAMLKGLSSYNISTSYSSRGWFDAEFNPARFEEYGRAAITTATAPLNPSERTKVLADYLAESIVEAAKATEKQQSSLNERNKKDLVKISRKTS